MLHAAIASAAGCALSNPLVSWAENEDGEQAFEVHRWVKDENNPVLPPSKNAFDNNGCMNPFVVRQEDQYLLFYAGQAADHYRICLATAPVGRLNEWKRHGPIFDVGARGAFDGAWCVLPCVHRIGGKWHLYYTGFDGGSAGLQSFHGMGLASSDDLFHWTKRPGEPVLSGDGFGDFPNSRGIAGGGRIIELPQTDGRILYRMHYTLPTGTPSKDLKIDQAKRAVIAHSYDGITWFDKRVVLTPRAEARYEDAATIALNVWKTKSRWRAIYAGIGTQFGAYSICEAVSDDGLEWRRGKPGQNLSLPPSGKGWESHMTTYPNVIEESGKLRLFYCGNQYGATGIGTAVADMLD